LYYSLIHSHLSYGILTWGAANLSVLHQTTLLQKRAISVIHNAKYNSHTDLLFRSSLVFMLPDIFEYHSVLFTFDFINNKLPTSFNSVFKFNRDVPNARLTRQSELLYIARCKSQFASRLPLYGLSITWQNSSRSICKNILKTQLLDSYPKVVKCSNSFCKECYL